MSRSQSERSLQRHQSALRRPDSNRLAGADGSGEQGSPGGEAEEEEFECPNNGIFADTASGCQAYHVCQSGAQVQEKFQCPLGTLFNNIILTCDFAHNVQCDGPAKQQPPTGGPAEPSERPVQRQPPPPPQQQRPPQQLNQPTGNRWPSSGPRQLLIGSQYNQHSNRDQPSRAQAVGSYPPQSRRPPADEAEADEAPEPLVPATLPPPRPNLQSLPYNPPPPPLPLPPSAADSQPSARQSAHLSQYPRHQQQVVRATARYQPLAEPTDGHNVASAATPVFVEPRATEPSVQQPTTGGHGDAAAQSFNLVVNHLAAPTSRPSGARSGPPPAPAPAQVRPQQQQQQQQQQRQQQVLQLENATPVYRSRPSETPAGALSRPRQQQRLRGGQREQQVRPAPANYAESASQPASSQRRPAGLVDLTNDRKSGGVSSEAMNDGLLLIVRHSAGSSPLQVTSGAGQAFAVEPALVSPNSALDGQLFPHVQSVLAVSAAGSGGPQASSPAASHRPRGQGQHGARAQVGGPLPPMEPPRPQVAQGPAVRGREQVAVAPSSELATAASSSPGAAGQRQPATTRSRRAKRLKPAQSPTSPATPTNTARATGGQQVVAAGAGAAITTTSTTSATTATSTGRAPERQRAN